MVSYVFYAPAQGSGDDPTAYATYLACRPRSFESEAIKTLIKVLDEDTGRAAHGFSVHIAHLSDADSLPLILVRVMLGGRADRQLNHMMVVSLVVYWLPTYVMCALCMLMC